MCIEVSIDERDPSLVRMRFMGKWTWRDYKHAMLEVFTITEALGCRVDIIADLTQAATAPLESDDHALRDGFEKAPGNLGILVIVDADQFTHMIITIMQKFIPVLERKMILTDTLANAKSIINLQRAIAQRTQPIVITPPTRKS